MHFLVCFLISFLSFKSLAQEEDVERDTGALENVTFENQTFLVCKGLDHAWIKTPHIYKTAEIDETKESDKERADIKRRKMIRELLEQCETKQVPKEAVLESIKRKPKDEDKEYTCLQIRVPEKVCERDKEKESLKQTYPINNEIEELLKAELSEEEIDEKYPGLCPEEIDHSFANDSEIYVTTTHQTDHEEESEIPGVKETAISQFLYHCGVKFVPKETVLAIGRGYNGIAHTYCVEVRAKESVCEKAKASEKKKLSYPKNEELDALVSESRKATEKREKEREAEEKAEKEKTEKEAKKRTALYEKGAEELRKKAKAIYDKDPSCWKTYNELMNEAQEAAKDNYPPGNMAQGEASRLYNKAQRVRLSCKK